MKPNFKLRTVSQAEKRNHSKEEGNGNERKTKSSHATKRGKNSLLTTIPKQIKVRNSKKDINYKKKVSEIYTDSFETRDCESYVFRKEIGCNDANGFFNSNLSLPFNYYVKQDEDVNLSKETIKKNSETLETKFVNILLDKYYYSKSPENTSSYFFKENDTEQTKFLIPHLDTIPDKSAEEFKKQDVRNMLLHHKLVPINSKEKKTNYEHKINQKVDNFFSTKPKLRYGKTVFPETWCIAKPTEECSQHVGEPERLLKKNVASSVFDNEVYKNHKNKLLRLSNAKAERKRKNIKKFEERSKYLDELEQMKTLSRQQGYRKTKDFYLQTIYSKDPAHYYDFCSGEYIGKHTISDIRLEPLGDQNEQYLEKSTQLREEI
ncbi:hypothetical protein ABK040_004837 [Willaertia magna]